MKKVNILIILACLFVSGVMFSLMYRGVFVKERRMVKWSKVSSVGKAGDEVAKFMFPIIQQSKKIVIEEGSIFGNLFFKAFSKSGARHTENGVFEQGSMEQGGEAFFLQVVDIATDFSEDCKGGNRTSCVGQKARNKFYKKDRDLAAIWINMYRLSENQAILFFHYSKPQE